jgi:hypothetical protein
LVLLQEHGHKFPGQTSYQYFLAGRSLRVAESVFLPQGGCFIAGDRVLDNYDTGPGVHILCYTVVLLYSFYRSQIGDTIISNIIM